MTDSLRILYIIDSLREAGAERSLVEISAPLIERGIDFHVAPLGANDTLAPQLRQAGTSVHRDATGLNRGRQLMALRRLIRSLGPDLVHTTLYEADVLGRSAARLSGIPYVTTFAAESYSPQNFSNPSINPRKLRAAQTLDAITARGARGYHAVSPSVADVMSDRLRLPRHRIVYIPRGRSRKRLGEPSPLRREKARASLGVAGEPLIVSVARHEHEKGLDVLIAAMAEVVRQVPNAVVLIAGPEGRETSRLRSLAGVQPTNCVRFLGRRDDVAELMVAADLVVVPSRTEGLPGVVLEAMALECNIVATDIAGVRAALSRPLGTGLVAPGNPARLAEAIILAFHEDRRGSEARPRCCPINVRP